MGRIVAIAGGSLETTKEINEYAIYMAGKPNANVLFIPTASKDDQNYIIEFTEAFNKLGCAVDVLTFTREVYERTDIDKKVEWADIIYVGDGNLIFMMNIWRKAGFDDVLYRVFSTDSSVLMGLGAGCACWFKCGYSNSEYNKGKTDWNYLWSENLLKIHNAAACPHYHEEGCRNFDRRLLENEVPGFALEDNTAFTQWGDRTIFLKSDENAKAQYIIHLQGELTHTDIRLKNVADVIKAAEESKQ